MNANTRFRHLHKFFFEAQQTEGLLDANENKGFIEYFPVALVAAQ